MNANPYQPPRADLTRDFDFEDPNARWDLPLRLAPHDLIDILLGMTHLCLFLLVGMLLSGLVFLATNSLGWVIGSFAAGYLVLLMVTVWSVRLSKEGIYLVRLLGGPRLIKWREIKSIEEADRREVVLRGWFEPRFPPREMTTTMTARGHVRIQYQGGWCYLPPKDAEEFQAIVDFFQQAAASTEYEESPVLAGVNI